MPEPCRPYCAFLDHPEDPDSVPICDTCGTCWVTREVTEVNLATGERSTQMAWTAL